MHVDTRWEHVISAVYLWLDHLEWIKKPDGNNPKVSANLDT